MCADIRSYDSVAVLGAGMSAFGYPMTRQLPALLWQAIGGVNGAGEELERRAARSGAPKEILGTDPGTVALGWQLARDLPAVRELFQRAFADLDAGRDPSQAHRELARLIHEGRMQFVISYNWDSCLERAYQGIYGIPLPVGVLVKPHGDVLLRDLPWTFPDEEGLVPQAVLDRLIQLDDRPRTLLVLGYSGSDLFVVEMLLQPLQTKWPVYQISPSATGVDAVPTTADDALAGITNRLVPQAGSTGWRYVVFDRSRGFEAALRGERLRPVDVGACPELPYARTLAERLAASRFATLSGGSGTGKSVTAFHAAKRLNQAGWAVVELTRAGVASGKEVETFAAMPGPVLAVVDDAQALDTAVIAEFQAVIDDDHAVLLVSTERLEANNDETVSDVRARDLIYQYCVDHLDEIEPLITALDDRVGPGLFRESARRRLQAAAASSRDPWSFMFITSGGEQRIEGILDRLGETPAAALLLGAVAVGQLTSLDAGVPPEQVAMDVAKVMSEAFGAPGAALDAERFNAIVDIVQSERLIRETSGRLRTAHIRVADRALLDLARRVDVVGSGVRGIVRSHLMNPDFPVRGKYWVLSTFTRSESLRYRWREEWLNETTVDALVAQCVATGSGADRSAAGFLLSQLAFARVVDRQSWEVIVAQLTAWLQVVDQSEVYGIARLIMHVRGDQEDLYNNLRRSMPATHLATLFSARGTRPSARAWADLLKEVAPNYGADARPAWGADFAATVDVDVMKSWLTNTTPESHNDEITELIDVLAEIAPTVASHALRACLPHLRESMESDMANAVHGFAGWAFGTMSLVAHVATALNDGTLASRRDCIPPSDAKSNHGSSADPFNDDPLEDESGERWEPTQDFVGFAAVTLEVMQEVDWTVAGASLNGRPRDELEGLDLFLAWLAWLSTDLIDHWADAISFDWLDKLAVEGRDSRTNAATSSAASRSGSVAVTNVDPIGAILGGMAQGSRAKERARTYLMDRLTTLQHLPFLMIDDLPDVAVAIVQAGGRVELEEAHGRGWESNARALFALRKVDAPVAELVFAGSEDNLVGALQAPQQYDIRGLAKFIAITDSLGTEHLDRMLVRLDAAKCEPIWRERLVDARDEAQALVDRAARVDGPLGDMARRLLRHV